MKVMHDFRCNNCNVVEEILHDRAILPECPNCHGPMEKLLSTPAGIGIGHKHGFTGMAGVRPDSAGKIPQTVVYTHRSRDGTK